MDCPRIHTSSFPTTDTSSTAEFSRPYGRRSSAARVVTWICCRDLSRIPKYRIRGLPNWKRTTTALGFFPAVKDTRCNSLPFALQRMSLHTADHGTPTKNLLNVVGPCKLCRIYLPLPGKCLTKESKIPDNVFSSGLISIPLFPE